MFVEIGHTALQGTSLKVMMKKKLWSRLSLLPGPTNSAFSEPVVIVVPVEKNSTKIQLNTN